MRGTRTALSDSGRTLPAMERFPRGSLVHFPAIATVAPHAVAKPPDPSPQADLSITCPTCSIEMQPEHAHYRCQKCGYRDSCCF